MKKVVLALQSEASQIGFAVFQGRKLIARGSKSISKGRITSRVYRVALPVFRTLVETYQPDVVVFSVPTDNPVSFRSRFLRALRYETGRIALASRKFSRHEVHKAFMPFLGRQRVNKESIMQLICKWFPSLKIICPKPRRIWESQARRVLMFDAIALAITYLARNE
jgi:RNase H-fold protein (predicted Holliday junction resolvase)